MQKAESRSKSLFEDKPVPLAFAISAAPSVISQLCVTVRYLADTVFIGKTGSGDSIAAVSAVFPVYVLLNAFGTLFGLGCGSEISRLLGEKNPEKVKKISSFGFWCALLLSALYSIAAYFLSDKILMLAGAGEFLSEAKEYYLWTVVFGGAFTSAGIALGGFLRGEGRVISAGLGLAASAGINVLLDYVFISLLKMGILGAGVAGLISSAVGCFFYLAVILFSKDTALSLKVKGIFKCLSDYKPIFYVGLPAAIAVILTSAANITLVKILSGYGVITVAAVGVVKKLDIIPLNIGTGIGQGALPIIAYNYAAKNYDRLKKTVLFSVFVGAVLSVGFTLLYELIPHRLIPLFVNGGETVSKGVSMLRISAAGLIPMVLFYILNTVVQGMEKGSESLFLVALKLIILNIPFIFLFNFLFKERGALWAEPTASLIAFAVSVAVCALAVKKCGLSATDK